MWRCLVLVLLCVAFAACSGSSSTPIIDTDGAATGGGDGGRDGGTLDDTMADAKRPGDGGSQIDGDGGADSTGDCQGETIGDGGASPDTATPPDFAKECLTDSDCESGRCIEYAGALACTMTCQENCPPGWICMPWAEAPEQPWSCLPEHEVLCRPCVYDSDCVSSQGLQEKCLKYPDDGSFCGSECASDRPCPDGYVCSLVNLGEGHTSRQCMRKTGMCPCSALSVELKLQSACSKSNDLGECRGARVCTDKGLGPCSAATPALETCDGLDNDCDGETDEGMCDDDNPCTADACEKGDYWWNCKHKATDGASCDDGNSCTQADTCSGSTCAGTPIICDDLNPCTDDGCDQNGKCLYEPNIDPCDDLDPCTAADMCRDGACSGIPVSCECDSDQDCKALDDGNPCNGIPRCIQDGPIARCMTDPSTVVTCGPGTKDLCQESSCNPATGKCELRPARESQLCDDADLCSTESRCEAGTCKTTESRACSDGNACTDDTCEPEKGCVFVAKDGPCDDGNACTEGDFCQAGKCTYASLKKCADSSACTLDYCDPQTGCVYEKKDGLPCDDGNLCTAGDTCAKGICAAGPALDCSDGIDCTKEWCAVGSGCMVSPDNSLCEDSNPCTQDACVAGSGCRHLPIAGPCKFNDPCFSGQCSGGKCVAGAPTSCEDSNPCTWDSCEAGIGCRHLPIAGTCQFSNPCYKGVCAEGVCTQGELQSCNDGNLCTDDSCDPSSGCVFTPNTKGCDDGNACTAGDKCSNGWCLGTAVVSCNDNNLCTEDSCHPSYGCLHAALAKPCNDGNPCTDDTCNPTTGCVFKPNGKGCEDGDVCTQGDTCNNGICAPGLTTNCSDSNACTVDFCDKSSGCMHTLAPDGTACEDDGNACSKDTCSGGVCTHSAAEGWASYGSHCYRYFTDNLSWDAARNTCLANGGELASFANSAESDFVRALTSATFWFGYNDIASEGSFVWSDGSPVTWTNWNSGEPNNSGNEDCAQVYVGGTWNDLPCTAALPFVCEKQ